MSRSDGATAAAAAAASRRAGPPAWILLDNDAFIDDTQNTSTATACTSTGHHIRVTLAEAEPPRDSYFCVHCPSLTKKRKHEDTSKIDLLISNCVVYSEGDLALLHISLQRGPNDYFVYKAGRRPSLRLLPSICSTEVDISYAAGVMPIGGDGEHFIVAAVSFNRWEEVYELNVFRSDHGTWTTTTLALEYLSLELTKVIVLGGGELGWVDPQKCILVCNVLDNDDPKARLIPLPKWLPSNRKDEQRLHPREYRDVVAGADGSITCVEIEHCYKRLEPRDVSTVDELHDSELPLDDYADLSQPKSEYMGWRIITWNRAASSTSWRKRGLIHVDDIVANDPGHTALLRPMAGDSDRRLTVMHLTTLVPSLNIHGGDVVYVMAKANQHDTKTWMLAVDMAKKTIEEVAPISAEQFCSPSYLSCNLSKYLDN